MPVLADTGILIDHLRAHGQTSRLTALALDDEVCVSVVSVYELEFGAARAGRTSDFDRLRHIVQVIPITEDDARHAGRLRAELVRQNYAIALPDLLIAVAALRNGLPIATLNPGHFTRVPGLTVV